MSLLRHEVSDRRAAANQSNAQKSTSPKTPRGPHHYSGFGRKTSDNGSGGQLNAWGDLGWLRRLPGVRFQPKQKRSCPVRRLAKAQRKKMLRNKPTDLVENKGTARTNPGNKPTVCTRSVGARHQEQTEVGARRRLWEGRFTG